MRVARKAYASRWCGYSYLNRIKWFQESDRRKNPLHFSALYFELAGKHQGRSYLADGLIDACLPLSGIFLPATQ